jgi:hypothetical protein
LVYIFICFLNIFGHAFWCGGETDLGKDWALYSGGDRWGAFCGGSRVYFGGKNEWEFYMNLGHTWGFNIQVVCIYIYIYIFRSYFGYMFGVYFRDIFGDRFGKYVWAYF